MIGRLRQADPGSGTDPDGIDDDLRLGNVARGARATLGKSLLDVQRDLKIKAVYIAAIEGADSSAFEAPGFIPGYVRSYARYLDLDPDWAFRAFCRESGFQTVSSTMSKAPAAPKRQAGASTDHPFGERGLNLAPRPASPLSGIEPRAIGSVAVLLALIGIIGYGGYAVLTEIQRVQIVPVEQAPEMAVDIDPLTTVPRAEGEGGEALAGTGRFDRLYRPEALEVPVLVARDGPIASLDPGEFGSFAGVDLTVPPRETAEVVEASTTRAGGPGVGQMGPVPLLPTGPVPLDAVAGAGDPPSPQVIAADMPEVVIFAVGPSWVRVRAADGTTLYERIMQEGDRFALPATEEPATLRTGESGAIYFAVNGRPYGPAGPTGQVTGNLPLDADNLTGTYGIADIETDTTLARVVAELEAAPPRSPPQE